MSNTGSPGRRDRFLAAGALFIVVLLAWVWILTGAGMEMDAVAMTAMAGMDGWLMRPAIWDLGYAAVMFAMWWAMMIAMMTPSAAPMLMLYAKVAGQAQGMRSALTDILVFAGGYALAWGLFSAMATGLQWVLEWARLLSPMLATTNVWLGAGLLIAAGAWQLTSLKARCLNQCRSPLSFLLSFWRPGPWGALRMGLHHGLYCLGCCWFLMGLLFFGGIMNLYWIIGIALFVLLEKAAPLGHWIGRLAGLTLIAAGSALAINAVA